MRKLQYDWHFKWRKFISKEPFFSAVFNAHTLRPPHSFSHHRSIHRNSLSSRLHLSLHSHIAETEMAAISKMAFGVKTRLITTLLWSYCILQKNNTYLYLTFHALHLSFRKSFCPPALLWQEKVIWRHECKYNLGLWFMGDNLRNKQQRAYVLQQKPTLKGNRTLICCDVYLCCHCGPLSIATPLNYRPERKFPVRLSWRGSWSPGRSRRKF